MKKNKETRIEQIVNDYFVSYGRQFNPGDIDYIMEFLKVMLMKKGRFKPRHQ